MVVARWLGAVAVLVGGVAGCAPRATYEYERPVTIVTTGEPRAAPLPPAGAPAAEATAVPETIDAPGTLPPEPDPASQEARQAAPAVPTSTPVTAAPPPTAPPRRPTSWRYGEKR